MEDRLKALLEDYNYVVIAPLPGKIEKIIITSLKQPPDKRYVSPYVLTTRAGAQHRVQAVITGPNNQDGVGARNGIYSTLKTKKLTKSATYVVCGRPFGDAYKALSPHHNLLILRIVHCSYRA